MDKKQTVHLKRGQVGTEVQKDCFPATNCKGKKDKKQLYSPNNFHSLWQWRIRKYRNLFKMSVAVKTWDGFLQEIYLKCMKAAVLGVT